MSESTTFLPALSSDNVEPEVTANNRPLANYFASNTIARLTNVSFFGSLASLVALLATFIVYLASPIYSSSWQTEADIGNLAFFTVLAALLSFFNRMSIRSSKSKPLLLNIIFDLILAFSICLGGLRFVSHASRNLRYPHCGNNKYGRPNDRPRGACLAWQIVEISFSGAVLLGALIVGMSHLTLLLIRGTNAWHSPFPSLTFPWIIPTSGRSAIEFNARIIRSEEEQAANDEQAGRTEESTETETLVEV